MPRTSQPLDLSKNLCRDNDKDVRRDIIFLYQLLQRAPVAPLHQCNRRDWMPHSREFPALHARAAAKFVTAASAFSSNVDISKNGQSVNGKSIMGVMMLAAGLGSEVEVETNGEREQEAMDALLALIADKFGEGE